MIRAKLDRAKEKVNKSDSMGLGRIKKKNKSQTQLYQSISNSTESANRI